MYGSEQVYVNQHLNTRYQNRMRSRLQYAQLANSNSIYASKSNVEDISISAQQSPDQMQNSQTPQSHGSQNNSHHNARGKLRDFNFENRRNFHRKNNRGNQQNSGKRIGIYNGHNMIPAKSEKSLGDVEGTMAATNANEVNISTATNPCPKNFEKGAPNTEHEKSPIIKTSLFYEDQRTSTDANHVNSFGGSNLPEHSQVMISDVHFKENLWLNPNSFNNGFSSSTEQMNILALNNFHHYHAQHQPMQYHKRLIPKSFPKDYSSQDSMYCKENFLKGVCNVDLRLEFPPNLRCQSQWDGVSEQIWEKYVMFQQSKASYYQKIFVWSQLYDLMRGFPLFQYRAANWSLHLVGSTISGFGLESSDIDICLAIKSAPHFDPRAEAIATLNAIKNYLIEYGSTFKNFSLINAKVPILRFRDSTNTIEVDLNYNNCIGVRNTHLLYCYSQLDWRLRPLVIMVKLWAQHHNLNDARNGTISSYSLVLMVIHFLQSAAKPNVLPCLHNLRPDVFSLFHDITTIKISDHLDVDWKSENNRPLGELFLRFLDYYSNFDYKRNVISVRTGGTLLIEHCKGVRAPKNDPNHWQTLCIEEPFDLTNTARSTYDWDVFNKIKNAFFQSWRRLNESKNVNALFQEPLFVKQIPNHHYYMPHMSTQSIVLYESLEKLSVNESTSVMKNQTISNPATSEVTL